jgi:hypothetical protein
MVTFSTPRKSLTVRNTDIGAITMTQQPEDKYLLHITIPLIRRVATAMADSRDHALMDIRGVFLGEDVSFDVDEWYELTNDSAAIELHPS